MEAQTNVPEIFTVPVTYNGVEHQFPLDIHRQLRRVHYLVLINGVNVAYESDGVDGLYTNLPADPQAMSAMPPMGLVHAVKAALLMMMPA